MKRSRPSAGSQKRRIERSGAGRIAFRPGKKHPLDVQLQEARQAKKLLEEQLALLEQEVQALAPLHEGAVRIKAEDEALRQFLTARYEDYFHQDHIESTFLWLRRRRAAARVQAARAALSLIQDLLAPDTFVDQLQEALSEQSAEEIKVDRVQLTGNAKTARDQLAHYDERLQEIRATITRGNGWIETCFVKKNGFKSEIIKLAYALYQERENGIPVPPETLAAVHPEIAACIRQEKPIPLRLKEEATTENTYGPYFKYRWREGNSPIYTISLGRISERPEGMLPFHPYIRFGRN